ncbi:MAG: GNAT family N-acetyltransferase [Rhodospirillaceae bacterium]
MPHRLPRPAAIATAPLAAADADAWVALLQRGFGLSAARIAHIRAGLGDGEIRVARRDDALAATAALMPMAQWFGGRPVPAVGLVAVTVDVSERRRGIAAALLRDMLEEARGRGLAFALLHAATLPLYQRLGFARAGACVDYQLDVPRTLAPLADPKRREPLRLTPWRGRDPAPLAALRARQGRFCNGLLVRPPLLWADVLSPAGDDPPEVLLIEGDDGPAGYLAHHPPAGERLRIVDLCLLGGGAARQVLGWLAGHAGRVQTALWPGGPADPLLHLAPEVDVDIDDWDLWLGRVVDVPAALAARGYPPGCPTRLDLAVEDTTLTANHGCWRLEVGEDGRAVVARAATPSPAIPALRLTVTALAPLFTSHLGASSLQAMGLIEGNPAAIGLADRLFAGPAPWLADRF